MMLAAAYATANFIRLDLSGLTFLPLFDIFAEKMRKTPILFLLFILTAFWDCQQNATTESDSNVNDMYEKDEAAILATIQNETKAAFQRDYEAWQSYWVHDEEISKTYINFAEDSFSESIGWAEINGFVKDFIEKNPEPDKVPELPNEIEVRWYKDGAWVVFNQVDAKRGLKRETRLMEKENGTWKIAGMHTTIYGKKEK